MAAYLWLDGVGLGLGLHCSCDMLEAAQAAQAALLGAFPFLKYCACM
jgi:hypothetical protein